MSTPRKLYRVYTDPENSEITGEFESLREVLHSEVTESAEIIQMTSGQVLAIGRGRRWDLTQEGLRESYETFAVGAWQMELPTEAGTYSVASRDGELAGLRYLVDVKGTLTDPQNIKSTGGSEWRGWWWSEPHPDLPNAPDGTKDT